jgi:hypothetical protein
VTVCRSRTSPDANVDPATVRVSENPTRRIITLDKDVTLYLPGRVRGSRDGSCPGEGMEAPRVERW